MKGNEAMAEAAIQAGCDAYFGYPITPQAEVLEWMARRMPNSAAPSSRPRASWAHQHGPWRRRHRRARPRIEFESGHQPDGRRHELHGRLRSALVLLNVMRGGPGLGSIGASQSDYFQATRGHGHGDYRMPVLAPSSITEAVALVADAFEIAERYRTPVMILADGVLGQQMEPLFPSTERLSGTTSIGPSQALTDEQPRVVRSLHLQPYELEEHNEHLQQKFAAHQPNEVRLRPKISMMQTSRSSLTARPHESHGRHASERAPRASGRASSGRSRCGRSRAPRSPPPRRE